MIVLVIMWGLANAPAPEGSLKFEFPDIGSCRAAADIAGKVIDAVPTKDGVKFFVACVPGKPAAKKPDQEI